MAPRENPVGPRWAIRSYARAISGLVKVVPTSGGVPSGSRYSASLEVMSSKKSTFPRTWSWKAWSTWKPSRATSMAGWSTSASDIVPYFASASAHPWTVPGTPAESPLYRAALKPSGAPFSKKDCGCMAAGAVSRWSMVVTESSAVRITMNPPPPMPAENGSVTPSTAAAATAASTALPPARSRTETRWRAEGRFMGRSSSIGAFLTFAPNRRRSQAGVACLPARWPDRKGHARQQVRFGVHLAGHPRQPAVAEGSVQLSGLRAQFLELLGLEVDLVVDAPDQELRVGEHPDLVDPVALCHLQSLDEPAELRNVMVVDWADRLGDRLHDQIVRVLQDRPDGRLASGLTLDREDAPVGVKRVQAGPRPRGLGDARHVASRPYPLQHAVRSLVPLLAFWPRGLDVVDLRALRNLYVGSDAGFTKLRVLDTQIAIAESVAALTHRKARLVKVAMGALVAAVLLVAAGLGLD